MQSDLNNLRGLLNAKSNLKDIVKFHSSINIIFHNVEAKYYDRLHSEMWDSLQPIYNAFVEDIYIEEHHSLKVLDIGCGTGLSTKMLLNTNISKLITEVTLLDTSNVMLSRAKSRFSNHSVKTKFHEGELHTLKDDEFDLILISSVLHHIPNLQNFFKIVNKKTKVGGLLFHIHDPNGDSIRNKIYLERVERLKSYKIQQKTSISDRIFRKINSTFCRLREPDYIKEVNHTLLKEKIIHTELTEKEIWSVTDIHVEGLPFSTNKGITISTLNEMLQNFKLIRVKTYSFFGYLESKLPDIFVQEERALFKSEDLHGRNIGAIWQKKN